MRTLPILAVHAQWLGAPARAALVALGSATAGGGRAAQAQEVGAPPAPSEPTFDRVEVERLFRETDRLMRQVEPWPVRTVRIRPTRGDFWTPGELQHLFGR
jgi:hypothetical protein